MFTRPLNKRQAFKLLGSIAEQHNSNRYSVDQSKSFYKGPWSTITEALRYKLLVDRSTYGSNHRQYCFKDVFITSDSIMNINRYKEDKPRRAIPFPTQFSSSKMTNGKICNKLRWKSHSLKLESGCLSTSKRESVKHSKSQLVFY